MNISYCHTCDCEFATTAHNEHRQDHLAKKENYKITHLLGSTQQYTYDEELDDFGPAETLPEKEHFL